MKLKWPNGAKSPVLLFIDDLCNRWVDLNNDNRVDLEEDWGYLMFGEEGIYKYLINDILSVNEEIKVTFFVPVGKRSNLLENSPYKTYSYPINHTIESIQFYSKIHNQTQHELAFHGLTHGKSGSKEKDFIQEWMMFETLTEAVETINIGKRIFKDTVGEYPKGGKYCGYSSNEFSDESIRVTGFKWWCRYPDYMKITSNISGNQYGTSMEEYEAFNPRFFNGVLDIPTTLPGDMVTLYVYPKRIVGLILKLFRKVFQRYKAIKRINYLLKKGYVISIQEHISPSRVDGKRQTPNIVDDKESLVFILKYLKKKKVWYCTGTELANYLFNSTTDALNVNCKK